jgi:hypothetical protein
MAPQSAPPGFNFSNTATDGMNKTKGTPASYIDVVSSCVHFLAVRSKAPINPLKCTGWTGIRFILLTGTKGRKNQKRMLILV